MFVGAEDLEVDIREDNEDEKNARTSSSFIDIPYTCNQPVHALHHAPEKQFPKTRGRVGLAKDNDDQDASTSAIQRR